jgi:hypothetical protein
MKSFPIHGVFDLGVLEPCRAAPLSGAVPQRHYPLRCVVTTHEVGVKPFGVDPVEISL